MTDTPYNPAAPDSVRERAEQGKEILGAQVATGEPGQKQPQHKDNRLTAQETVEQIEKIQNAYQGEFLESSASRSQKSGNTHPVPPEERTLSRGPQVLAAADTAAGALGAARDAITSQLAADARLTSDPRYERDQKVYELGQTGKLAGIAPAPAEAAAAAEKAGVSEKVAELIPRTPEEQVAQDMPRLEEQEKKPASVTGSVIQPGVQDSSDKNNGLTAYNEGKTGDDAVAKAKGNEVIR